MKNKLSTLLLVSTFVLSGLAAATVAEAAEVNSKADVQFKANEEGTGKPHDPEKPDPEEVDPDDDIEDPVIYPKGALRFHHVPTLSFGINEINAKGQTIDALLENIQDPVTKVKTPRASFVEVADERGDLAGWNVTVKSDGIFKSAKGNIEGTITFSAPAIRGINGMESKPEAAPTGAGFSIGKDFVGDATVMTAAQGKGYNMWQARYGHSDNAVAGRNANVKLTIPKGQLLLVDAKYKANLIWTLSQTP